KLQSLRTRFMGRFAKWLIFYAESGSEVDSTIDFLKKAHYPENRMENVVRFAQVQKTHFIGNIGKLSLLTPDKQQISIASLLDKPSVFYYWSMAYDAHQENIHNLMKTLRKRYPEL